MRSSPPRHCIADQLRSGASPQEFNDRSARGHVLGGRIATSTSSSAEISPQFPSKSWINLNRLLPGPCRPGPHSIGVDRVAKSSPQSRILFQSSVSSGSGQDGFPPPETPQARTLSIDRYGTGIGCRAAGSTCQASPHRKRESDSGVRKVNSNDADLRGNVRHFPLPENSFRHLARATRNQMFVTLIVV